MEFAEYMQMSPAGASQLVERLVQQGLARRVESPGDRRVRQVHLTEGGRQEVEAGIAARGRWVASLVASLPDEEKGAIARAVHLLTARAAQMDT